jgi:hypothetical protein
LLAKMRSGVAALLFRHEMVEVLIVAVPFF